MRRTLQERIEQYVVWDQISKALLLFLYHLKALKKVNKILNQ
jgi:hypothetical protein